MPTWPRRESEAEQPVSGPARPRDLDGADGADVLAQLMANSRVRFALGAGIVVVLFFLLSVIAMVLLLVLSNGHGASIDSQMSAMKRDLFAGSHAQKRSLQTNIEHFKPQLNELTGRLATIEKTIGLLPTLNSQITTLKRNTSSVARFPVVLSDMEEITHQSLPTLTTDIGGVIHIMRPIASDIGVVTKTMSVLPRVAGDITGMASTLNSTQRHLIAMQKQTAGIKGMAGDLSHMRTDIDTVTKAMTKMIRTLASVERHVRNLDRKFPGTPVTPTAGPPAP